MSEKRNLSPDRHFDPEPGRRRVARGLYETVQGAPIVGPHGHVDPKLLADPEASLGTPAELFIIPDHYVFRMLYSQGVPMEDMGVQTRDGSPVETDHRRIWQRFAENFYLFRATPTGMWLKEELTDVFGVEEDLTGENAQRVYDHLEERLSQPEFSPRFLFNRFNIEVLCTTDGASDSLESHASLQREGWGARVRPTFRPDGVANIDAPSGDSWRREIEELSAASNIEITDYRSFIEALEERRDFFREMGAVATDHSARTPYTARLSEAEAQTLFARGLAGEATGEDAERFTGHLFMEFARMSAEDGLVMQLHIGSLRSHNALVAERFGSADKGADIPLATEWTRNLKPLLNEYGNHSAFRLIVYTLDESTYSRELAPMAGHYPALYLGAPWWFFDSPNGMRRYLDAVTETAGIYNLAGFNDDTRAFASIPVRHDMWRRVVCDWLAEKVTRHLLDEQEASQVAADLAYRQARRAYRLESPREVKGEE
jgi:glucuronate isomerase